MTQPGLTQISPDLVLTLRQGSPEFRRKIVEKACLRAVEVAGVETPIIRDALAAIRGRGVLDPDLRMRVDKVTQEMDEAAWDIQDRVDSGESKETDYAQAFSRARAAAAVGFALGESLSEVFDALYEAYYAIDDKTDFLRVVFE